MTTEGAARIAGSLGPSGLALVGLSNPAAPAVIAVLACVLVRIPLINGRTLRADLSVTCLAILGAFVTTLDRELGAGQAFWLGLGFGGAGSTLIQVGKSAMGQLIGSRLKDALAVAFGVNGNGKDTD
jgi:hypothetical protein